MGNSLIKNFVRDYFTFTKSERNGILVLCFLIIITVVFRTDFIKLFQKKSYSLVTKVELLKFKEQTSYYTKYSETSERQIYCDTTKSTESKSYKTAKPQNLILELNSADSISLEKLPGIGKYLSRGIVKYRKMLGGYYQVNQLKEVYGMHPENFDLVQKHVKIDTSLIQKISISEASFKEINAHPYISYDQTKLIFKYRNRGIKINRDLLLNNEVFDTLTFLKLQPYLVLDK